MILIREYKNKTVLASEEIADGIIIDYDENNKIVGADVLYTFIFSLFGIISLLRKSEKTFYLENKAMSTITENDIQELKDLINQRFDELNGELKTVDKKIDIYIAKTDEKLDSIQRNIDDLKKQSERQDNRLWILVTGLFLTLMGAVAKIVFFPNP